MKKIKSYDELQKIIKEEKQFMLYVSMKNCSICNVDMPKIEKISEENNFVSYNLEASEVPEAVGQLSLFAVPVVILFYEGKEFHRQAKIIDFEELEYRIGQISKKY